MAISQKKFIELYAQGKLGADSPEENTEFESALQKISEKKLFSIENAWAIADQDKFMKLKDMVWEDFKIKRAIYSEIRSSDGEAVAKPYLERMGSCYALGIMMEAIELHAMNGLDICINGVKRGYKGTLADHYYESSHIIMLDYEDNEMKVPVTKFTKKNVLELIEKYEQLDPERQEIAHEIRSVFGFNKNRPLERGRDL
jgi:hypothetical protein